MKLFYRIARLFGAGALAHADGCRTAPPGLDDPLRHPDIAAMSQRALADLPLPGLADRALSLGAAAAAQPRAGRAETEPGEHGRRPASQPVR